MHAPSQEVKKSVLKAWKDCLQFCSFNTKPLGNEILELNNSSPPTPYYCYTTN